MDLFRVGWQGLSVASAAEADRGLLREPADRQSLDDEIGRRGYLAGSLVVDAVQIAIQHHQEMALRWRVLDAQNGVARLGQVLDWIFQNLVEQEAAELDAAELRFERVGLHFDEIAEGVGLGLLVVPRL